MKKKILIIISILILLSTLFFYYSNKSIEGLYIKNYEIFSTDSNQDIYYDQYVLEIKNQKFDNYFYGSNGIPSSFNYKKNGKNIKLTSIKNDSSSDYNIVLNKNHKDSIVFKTDRNNGEVVYFKIPDSLKNNTKISLAEKTFVLKSEKFIDTIYFDKDYLLIKDLNPTDYWDTGGWELLNINGFDIILTGYSFVYVVKDINEKLFFYRFLQGNRIVEIESFEIEGYDLTRVKKIIERLKQLENE